jgi:hypothetical protein
MADDTSTPFPSNPGRSEGRGNRSGADRDGSGGGFRIRLSDNEMQAARALQDAFGLRSTVAVLGFALRTLAQQLEQGQLDELVARTKAEAGSRPRGGGERRRDERPERGDAGRGGRANPFARPSRPAAPVREEAAAAEEAPSAEESPSAASEEAAADLIAPPPADAEPAAEA